MSKASELLESLYRSKPTEETEIELDEKVTKTAIPDGEIDTPASLNCWTSLPEGNWFRINSGKKVMLDLHVPASKFYLGKTGMGNVASDPDFLALNGDGKTLRFRFYEPTL